MVLALALLAVLAVVFAYSPTLNPSDIIAGRFLEVPVPQVLGLTQDRALIEFERNRLHGDVEFVYSSTVDRGKVVRQDPVAATSVKRESTVRLFVSRGGAFVTIPELTGKPRSEAAGLVKDLGLTLTEELVNDEGVAADAVISQKPAAGLVVEGGAAVSINVSSGPMSRSVPEVTGLPIEGAAFNLGKAGFTLGTVTPADNPLLPAGGVIGTDPPAATVLPRDTPINVLVSSGPPPVAVPKVTGLLESSAASDLAKLGFVLGSVSQTGAVADPLNGVVLSQSPEPGTSLRPGEIVTVTVRRAAIPPPTVTTTVAPAPTVAPSPATPPAGP